MCSDQAALFEYVSLTHTLVCNEQLLYLDQPCCCSSWIPASLTQTQTSQEESSIPFLLIDA